MNVKIITRHAPVNYGSLLQSIATIKVIEGLGFDGEIIDYQRSDEIGIRAVLTDLRTKKSWNSNLLKRLLYVILRYPESKLGELKFQRMRNKYLKKTEKITNYDDLKKLKADVFLTGSDQVWGTMLNGTYDKSYFLTFVPDGVRKVAYAASFGKSNFERDVIDDYKKMLSSYVGITVRENRAHELLHEWQIPSMGHVLDPTLLLTGNDWGNFIEKEIKGKYVLIYEIHNNPLLDEYAIRFSKHIGLPLIRVSAVLHQINRGGKFVYSPNISEFLAYIKGCSYLITDSFHGTAFGLNFNRQIIEVMPNNATGSRNLSILQLTGLTDRIVADFTDFSLADRLIDYSRVNDIISKERKKSIQKLKELLNVK